MAQQLGERLPYLQERSAIKPDADHDIFAFMTSEGEREQLSRSDIERILSAHPQGHDLYLSGAGLWGINLSGLKTQPAPAVARELEPFPDARVWLDHADVHGATLEEIDLRSARMEGIDAHGILESYTDTHGIDDVADDVGGESRVSVQGRRGAVGDRRPDMRGQPGHVPGQTCLHRAKLGYAHLEQANLSKACLRGTRLDYTCLQRADLSECYLQEAYLPQAHLEGAILRGAHMQKANLTNAQLGAYTDGSNIVPTDLSGAHLDGAILRGAQLRDALLDQASLRGAELPGANLQGARLAGANLEGAGMEGADLRDADLMGARLQGVTLAGAQLQGPETRLKGADLQGVNLRQQNLEGVDLEEVDLRGADLTGACLRGAHLAKAQLQGATLVGTDLRGAQLKDADLQGAILNQAMLDGATLKRANLRDANLERTNLQGADLREARLQGANFYQAWFDSNPSLGYRPADLQRAVLDVTTTVTEAVLGNTLDGFVTVADTAWNGANLATTAWAKLVDAGGKLGDELAAEVQLRQIRSRSPRKSCLARLSYHGGRFWHAARSRPLRQTLSAGRRQARSLGYALWSRVSAPRSLRSGLRPRSRFGRLRHRPHPSSDVVRACIDAARANRQLALVFAAQGLSSEAAVLDYRAHLWQRKVLQLTLGWKHLEYWESSLLLVVSGYGYKVWRSLVTYVFLILLFAAANLWGAPLLPPYKHVPPGLALLLSVLSFHGRGFVSADLATKTSYSIIAALEAVVGLVFEAIFIATLIRRLFR